MLNLLQRHTRTYAISYNQHFASMYEHYIICTCQWLHRRTSQSRLLHISKSVECIEIGHQCQPKSQEKLLAIRLDIRAPSFSVHYVEEKYVCVAKNIRSAIRILGLTYKIDL